MKKTIAKRVNVLVMIDLDFRQVYSPDNKYQLINTLLTMH